MIQAIHRTPDDPVAADLMTAFARNNLIALRSRYNRLMSRFAPYILYPSEIENVRPWNKQDIEEGIEDITSIQHLVHSLHKWSPDVVPETFATAWSFVDVPTCPDCDGEDDVYIDGQYWMCGSCGAYIDDVLY